MELLKKNRVAHVTKFPEDNCQPDLAQVSNKIKIQLQADTGKDEVDKPSPRPRKKPKKLASGSLKNESTILPKSMLTMSKAMKFSETLTPRSMELRKSRARKNMNETKMFSDVIIEAEKERLVSHNNAEQGLNSKKSKLSVSIYDIQAGLQDVEDVVNPPPITLVRPSGRAMDWDEFLLVGKNLQRVPPVDCFKSAPLAQIWKKIAIPGLAIELRNPFVEDKCDVFWIGTIVHYAGYRALVQFETMMETNPDEGNYLTWISYCSDVAKPLGWCINNSKEMVPGPIVSADIPADVFQRKLSEFYKKPTIDQNLSETLLRELDKMKSVDHQVPVEVMDTDCFQENRLGRISAIFGNRVHVEYYPKENEKSFFFNYNSDSLHRFGWSHTVGVKLNGIGEGIRRSPLPPEEFPSWPENEIQIKVGMRLETRHPFLVYKIVGAVITKVLKHGYFIVQTLDVQKVQRENFVYHVTSPFIFPVGFGAENGFRVEFGDFKSPSADSISASKNVRLDLLPPRPPHKFQVGFKVEAIDVLDGWFIGAATIKKIAGHLLYLHFDNWKDDVSRNYAWVDTEKSDIFPLGYCEMIGLEWRGSVEL